RPGDSSALADESARLGQVRRIGRVPGELEREIAFDAGGKIAWRAVIHRPAAVVALVVADVLRDSAPMLFAPRPEEVREKQVLGVHRGVRFQLRPPVALGVLFALEPPLRALDDEVDPRALDPGLAPDHETPRRARWPRSRARSSPSATSSTSITFMPVSTYAGRRPSRKSRITAPVGVGLTSPTPTGNVGFTMTASSPRRASSRTMASASRLLSL